MKIASMLLCLCIFFCAELYAQDISQRPLLWGFALEGYPITYEQLEKVENETGLKPDIVVFFLQWQPPGRFKKTEHLRASLDAIWDIGAVPCITWEPMYYKDGLEITVSYETILNGSYDNFISEFARKIKSWGKPVFVRFAHEMNIVRYHWGTDKKGYGARSPEIYRNMFRYVVSLFRRAGADNVLWVFCPNTESVPNTSYDPAADWNLIKNYYPGNDYVDIFGIDGYNWGATQKKAVHGWDSQWRGFREIFEPAYKELLSISSGKPVLIFETATVDEGGDKKLWIKKALETAKAWNIQGIVWFQSNKELDWRINSGKDYSYKKIIRHFSSPSHNWVEGILQEKKKAIR